MKYAFDRQLVLADGTVFKGYGFGATTAECGEIVFNTGMTGYQETLSDPSYYGQIIVFTYPLIGNYGINRDDFETITPSIKGVVCREYAEQPSNFRCRTTIDELLTNLGIPGIAGIDTRALTKKIRDYGTIKAIIADINADVQTIVTKLQATVLNPTQIAATSTKSAYPVAGCGYRVVLVDLGMKSGILRELTSRGCDVVVVPYNTSANEILRLHPDGVMLTNGPGDPMSVPETIAMIKEIMPLVPIFGICMGHQLLSLAAGAKTYKLKFGHRGTNHPVKNLLTNKVTITSQNHGFAVDIASLETTELELTHISENDHTCEGVRHKYYPVFSVQYHPEAAPGPHDANELFDQFISNMQIFSKQKSQA